MFSAAFLSRVYLPLVLLWVAGMFIWDQWGLFIANWFMSVTMAAGSFIAGSTSIGGGAVAFPVMTLAFGIDPAVARDFSLMIQAVGMMAAAAAIFMLKIPVERRALLWAGLGALPALLLGYEFIAPLLPRPAVKTLFGSFVFSFGLVLWWLNRHRSRFTAAAIRRLGRPQALGLVAAGALGGAISGILGSGADIVVFSLLVLRFGVSEKVATHTSVVLMGGVALAGMAWGGATGALAAEAWDYWWVCVPIVAFGAPFGAWCASRWPRIGVVRFLCALIAAQYAGTLLIVPQTPGLMLFNACVIGASMAVFWWLRRGYRTHRAGLGGG